MRRTKAEKRRIALLAEKFLEANPFDPMFISTRTNKPADWQRYVKLAFASGYNTAENDLSRL